MTDPEKLQDALKRGLEANRSGKPAVIDVIVADDTEGAVVPTVATALHALYQGTTIQNREG